MSEQLRALMRLLAHSVVVCTSTTPGTHSRPPTPRAMTMSSFTSLALNPAPVVSFNVATPSRTLDAIRASGKFNVHILAGNAAGARVAHWFTQGNDQAHRVFRDLSSCGVELAHARAGSGPEALEAEPPVLMGEGILYTIRCELLPEPQGGLIRVRDHVIVLGEVVEIVEKGEKGGIRGSNDCFGLVYADRQYRQLGNSLVRVDRASTGSEEARNPDSTTKD